MKKNILTLSLLLTSVVFANNLNAAESLQKESKTQAQATLVPHIDGPAENILNPSSVYTFTSDTEGIWTVWGGVILSGQGTNQVTVRTDKNTFNTLNNFGISIEANGYQGGKSYYVAPSNGVETPIEL